METIFSFSLVLSQILPVIADIVIAVVYFVTVFDHWIGMIVFTTMVGYVGKFRETESC